jgi:hypothetical protein
MENVQLNLSPTQLSKLRNGHNIQIKPGQMGSGMNFRLNANNMKKLRTGYNKAKAIRMAMNDEEIEGSGLGKKLSRGLHKATHIANKVGNIANKVNDELHNENLDRKILSTSRQIKNTINKGSIIGDLGIPVVSDGYNLIQQGATRGDRLVKQGIKAKSKLVSDFDDANNEYRSGSGNPYLSKNGGSFRTLGGSFKTQGGNMKRVKLQTDSAININSSNPSFHPLKPKTFDEIMHGGSIPKCRHCNH